MDLRQLRYFVGIIQAGSLSRAAGQLHVAPSALSHHLGALESELGRDLVTRGPNGVRLTESGTVLSSNTNRTLPRGYCALSEISAIASIDNDASSFCPTINTLLPLCFCKTASVGPLMEFGEPSHARACAAGWN